MILKPLNILHLSALPKSYYTSILIFSTNDFGDFIQDLLIFFDFNAMLNLLNKVVFSFYLFAYLTSITWPFLLECNMRKTFN
jgi:hypothetical protein